MIFEPDKNISARLKAALHGTDIKAQVKNRDTRQRRYETSEEYREHIRNYRRERRAAGLDPMNDRNGVKVYKK